MGPALGQALVVVSGDPFCPGEPVLLGQGSGLSPRLWGLLSQPQEPPSLPQVLSWKSKLPLQTIMRLLQVLVPQVEKICIDK